MTKNYKAVLKSSLVMLVPASPLAVVSSGVAQAQECIARAWQVRPTAVRAEGITETVGTIELRCSEPMGVLGFGSPDSAGNHY